MFLLERNKQLHFDFANQGLNQDEPTLFGYRAYFENLFTQHVIILMICSILLVCALQIL
jgi:hypothetical protein